MSQYVVIIALSQMERVKLDINCTRLLLLSHTWQKYLLAFAMVALAALLRVWPLHILGSTLVWITFYPAVMLVAVLGNFAAGLLATILACATAFFLWPFLAEHPFINGAADWLGMAVFIINGTAISCVAEAARRANIRARKAQKEAEAATCAIQLSSEAVIKSERFIKSVTDAIPGMVSYWDKNLICRFANARYAEWFGYHSNNVVGATLHNLLGERLYAQNAPFIQGVLAGKQQCFERTLTKADGTIAYALVNYVPDTSAAGTIEGFFALIADVTPLKKAELNLRSLMDASPYLAWLKNADGRYLAINKTFADYLRLDHPQLAEGKSDFDLQSPELAQKYRADDAEVMKSCRHKHVEEQAFDGERLHWIETFKTPIIDEHGNIQGTAGFAMDITERKQAEYNRTLLTRALKLLSKCNALLIHTDNEQKLLEEICHLAVETGGYLMAWVGFAEHDPGKAVRAVAQSGFEEGYLDKVKITWDETEFGQGPTGTAIRTRSTVVNQNCLSNPNMAPWRQAAIARGYQSSIALPLVVNNHALGALTIYSSEPFTFSEAEVELLNELANDLAYGIATLRTRCERDDAERKLDFLTYHDSLTGLPNRLLLHDRVEQAIVFATQESTNVALLFLDLDNFKQINDSFGHALGDQLLLGAAVRLKKCLSETDTMGRLSGDKFIILLPKVQDLGTVEAIAQNILEGFADPFNLDGRVLSTSFSIGISMYPNDGSEFGVLLQNADAALYQAKDAGRNTYRFFSQKMNVDETENIKLQAQLRNAIRQQEFILHFQPQIDILSGKINGAEALVRWQHPELGLVPPTRFIPLAERSGLIIPLGEWVLNEACRQMQVFQNTYHIPPIVIAVNLSAMQFKRGNIVDTVANALSASGLPANQLELEITESTLIQDIDSVVKTLQGLKEIGVKLSIDDFGTGYSSFSYLKRLAVDKLKVDQSFVRDMTTDPGDAAIVNAIIQLGHILQMTVIAEGVENEAQMALLKKYECDEIQGYLFSRPLTPDKFADFCLHAEMSPQASATY
ncbi:MAG: EAL domain-containing protein [Burkholderiales bacterium]